MVIFVLISAPLILNFLNIDLVELLKPFTQLAHQQCLNQIKSSDFPQIQAALACGISLEPSTEKRLLTQWGLIHLFVVSGAHLIFIKKWTSPIKKVLGTKAEQIFLFGFVLTAQFSAPITRAFAQQFLAELKLPWARRLNGPHRVLIAGLITLTLSPQLIHGYSLLLSWLASLAISLAPRKTSAWGVSGLIILALSPALHGFSVFHPLQVIGAVLGGWLIGTIAFPLSIAALFLPGLNDLTDNLWNALFRVLSLFEIEGWGYEAPHSLSLLWIYLALIQCFTIFWIQSRSQNSDQSTRRNEQFHILPPSQTEDAFGQILSFFSKYFSSLKNTPFLQNSTRGEGQGSQIQEQEQEQENSISKQIATKLEKK